MEQGRFDRAHHDEMCDSMDRLFEECVNGTLNIGAVAVQTDMDHEILHERRLGHPGTYDIQSEKIAAFGPSLFPKLPK